MSTLIEPALTVKDLASLLNVDEKTVYRLVQKGGIPGFKVAGTWRFISDDIAKWIADQKSEAKKSST
jgi:excisionase family DNA binding protein